MNPSERIDQLIGDLRDWRGKTLANVRKIILAADKEIIEDLVKESVKELHKQGLARQLPK